MTKSRQTALLGVFALLLLSTSASAQISSETVGFNGPPIDDPATSQEMFLKPEASGSTDSYILANDVGQLNANASFRAGGLHTEGTAAMQVFFKWLNAADPDAWIRLTTLDGPQRPNPSLHTQGKVSFKFTNQSELFAGTVGVCIGIRETGNDVPQLADGGTSGTIEWFGVDDTPNGILAGADGIVDTTATGDDVQEYAPGFDIVANSLPTGTAVISPGTNGVLDTAPAGDDEIRRGYTITAEGERRPVCELELPPNGTEYEIVFDMGAGTVSANNINNASFDGTPVSVATAGFTGNGVLDAANNRGTLEHIAITNVATDGADDIVFAIDELSFDAPVSDPAVPPTVAAPIVAGETTVTVTDIQYTADQVTLYRNGGMLESKPASWPSDVSFTVTSAMPGQQFTATQREGNTQAVSAESLPVTVLTAPPPFTFSILVDNGGTGSCNFNDGWEWAGVSSTDGSWIPNGTALLVKDSLSWQEVDVPLDDDAQVLGQFSGDNELGPSPSGYYTIDSLWWTIAPGASASDLTHDVFVDRIELLDSGDNVTDVIHMFEDGKNYLINVRDQSNNGVTTSNLSSLASYDGDSSHRVTWTYDSADPGTTIGLYHNATFQCGNSPLIPDSTATVRFHMYIREPALNGAAALPEILTPIIVGTQDTVRVLTDASANTVELFVNGSSVGAPIPVTGTETDFSGLGLNPGDSISAYQSFTTEGTSDPAYARVVSGETPPPTIVAPLEPDATSVTLEDILDTPFAEASMVTVYVDSATAGTADPSGDTVVVPISAPLVNDQVVTATQTVNGLTSDLSLPLTVGFPPPVIYAAPAEGDATVRVVNLYPGASSVTVETTDGMLSFSEAVPTGEDSVDVPVSGLMAGDEIWANQTVNAATSSFSEAETVTVNTNTPVYCNDFEQYADQTAFDADWSPTTGDTQLALSTDQNTTELGSQSAYSSEVGTNRSLDVTTESPLPTDTEPLVWNLNFFDDASNYGLYRQYAEILSGTPGSSYLIAMGKYNAFFATHYNARIVGGGGLDWMLLDHPGAPAPSPGWHTFTAVFKSATADIYVDGILSKKNTPYTPGQYTDLRMGSGLSSAGGGAYFDDNCLETGRINFNEIAAQPPLPPTLASPILDGDMEARVTGIVGDATAVTVYENSNPPTAIGTYIPSGTVTSGIVDVPLQRGLIFQERIYATQTDIDGESGPSDLIEVGDGNGTLRLALGIRETGDAGALGTPGGSSGDIEWIDVTGQDSGNAPLGQQIVPMNVWQTVTFDAANGVISFVGDDTITATRGVLEHLAITVDSVAADRSSGSYVMYIDNVINVQADGGSDFVIEDFEGYGLTSEVLFQEPNLSGSTAGNLSLPPDASEVTDTYANGGTQSLLVTWFFKDTNPGRWVRLTTFNALNRPSPIIDLTKPIQMDILLLADTTITTGACEANGTCIGGLTAAECADLTYACDQVALGGTGCQGDADLSGVVNASDRGFVSANIGITPADVGGLFATTEHYYDALCATDLDGSGVVNASDRGFVSANIGLCTPLNDYQNGSGMNGGVPDPRFPEAVFQGEGSFCP